MNKYLLAGLALLIGLGLGYLIFGGAPRYAGTTHFGTVDAESGFTVDGTSAIDSSRNYSGGTGAFTGRVTSVGVTNTGTFIQSGATTHSGAFNLTGAGTVTGQFTIDAIGSGIHTSGVGTSTTYTAANICDNTLIDRTSLRRQATSTLPTAVALQADCLDIPGSYRDVLFENLGTVTTTITFTVGASSTLERIASTTANLLEIHGGDGAVLRFYSSTTTTSNAAMVKIKALEFDD